MKVGILTFHNTINYGALLQAYALRNVLIEMGHDVYIIDYKCQAVTNREKPRKTKLVDSIKHPRFFILNSFHYEAKVKRRDAFEQFCKEHILFSDERIEQDICQGFDAVVVGSDQVWSLRTTKGDESYFLGGHDASTVRRIAYAASFGAAEFTEEQAFRCGNAIRAFHAVSVRERSGVTVAYSIGGFEPSVVLDPTLLLKQDKWKALSSPRQVDDRYIFCYMVSDTSATMSYAKEQAKLMGVRLIGIDCYGKAFPAVGVDWRNDASPSEFLSLIQYADLVVASSFHGFALSVAMGVPVRYSLNKTKNNANSRLEDLAKMLGMEKCCTANIGSDVAIDSDLVNRRLEIERNRSLQWLNGALAV